ncbi:hypothetical protein HXA34_11310 [Salipaludibacillus agaradhaerens]|jgi:hypothetical protein|uniref:hypothetical protein n=1 Tax=Salipaludibacillus agaradhaerens TaxID=76935 RepID=UPI00215170B6|nr:hypothetical protein [Salipaludibacillus agaradhaerens]MCR6106876.1 hypothetical protein [Salipaludibacillus agaradhaerens]MCR6118908.1 hypothetical protein [Salipaludibacillus agaradhaerens]
MCKNNSKRTKISQEELDRLHDLAEKAVNGLFASSLGKSEEELKKDNEKQQHI